MADQRRQNEACSCTFVESKRHGEVVVDGIRKRPIYLDFVEDETTFDPQCPYHGDHGSMVVLVPVGASVESTPRGPNEGSGR